MDTTVERASVSDGRILRQLLESRHFRSRQADRCPMAHDVFISYSSKDKPVADAVCAGLESRGVRCWVAPRDILPGADWGGAIIDALSSSKVMVLIFSSNANTSPQIKREVERAVAKGVKLVPFRIEDVPLSKNLEYFISTPHWLDAMTQPLEAHIAKLAETVSFLAASRDSTQVPPPPLPSKRYEVIPNTPEVNRIGRVFLALLVVAGAFAAYRWVARKSPPEIIAVNFPASITAGSRDVVGTVQFKSNEAIAQAQFDVVEAQRFDPFSIQPRTGGEKRGSFSFALHSNMPQQVTLKTTLIDSEGRRSSPVSFSFEVRRASAAQPRSIEIDTRQLKFKIPH